MNTRFVSITLLTTGMIMLATMVIGSSFFFQSTPVIYAQDDLTPTVVPTEQFEPFVQNDLQIISGNVQRPNGIFWHDGFLWTACAGDSTIYRIDDTTGETITYLTGVQNTHTLHVEDGPEIWLADFQRNAFVQVGVAPRQLNVIADELGSPWGVVAAEDDTFYMTFFRTSEIVNINREGEIEVIAQNFRDPTGIAIDENYVYVANNGSARRAVEWFEISDDISLPLTEDDMQPLVSGLQNTTNLVMGPDDYLYFAYALGTRGIIGRVDPEVCREQGGCTGVDVEVVLWSELAAPLAGLTISDDMRLYIHTMFGAEIYWLQLPQVTQTEDTESEEPDS